MTEPFRCPLCGGTGAVPVMTLHDRVAGTTEQAFTLARCESCDLLRLHPPPDAATLELAYGAGYAPHTRPGLSGRAKGWLERRSVGRLWPVLRPPRRVLDVGCARGELLLAIRDLGNAKVVGVEPGEAAAETARSHGLRVLTGFLEDAGFPDGSFDTVIASHTLEHVTDPIAFLREVRRILTPPRTLVNDETGRGHASPPRRPSGLGRGGGMSRPVSSRANETSALLQRPRRGVLLWLPNADSVEARLFGRYWIGYDAPRHLTTFSIATLRRALHEAGFELWSVKHEVIGLEWAWALRLWLRERWPACEPVLRRLHPLLIVLGTPLAALSALLGRSGRIRIVAVVRGH